MPMKALSLLLPLLAGCAAVSAGEPAAPPRILAVFAHPDDETTVAPALANAARRGAHVRVVYATKGDASAPFTDLAPGPAIAAHRSAEATCASRALGAGDPLLLDFGDGKLGEIARPPWSTLRELEDRLASTIDAEKPDVIITWGPDGGYGHPDHRLVGAAVTKLIAAREERPLLLYAAMELGTLPPVAEFAAMSWAETAPELLTLRARFAPEDLAATARAFACHASQYDEATRAGLIPVLSRSVWAGGVPFRPALDPAKGDDLLSLER